MAHLVIFRSPEGKAGYHRAEVLDEAIRFVERLRDSDHVEQARIFRMDEVAFELRPSFRVEVSRAGSAPDEEGARAGASSAGVHVAAGEDRAVDEVGAARCDTSSR